MVESNPFDASELCSRKLWQLVSEDKQSGCNKDELRKAINELAERRHYLQELQEMGKL